MGLNWQPLAVRRSIWDSNLDALAARNPMLAQKLRQIIAPQGYVIAEDTSRLHLGRENGNSVTPLPNPVPANSARDIAAKLYPTGQCTGPVMVAGLDQGWLWNQLYQLPCHTPMTPGHRPPLYFLARDIERLSVVMHLHDWTKLLGDDRVRLFVGEDAVDQCHKSMIANPTIPWAKLSVTVDPALWPAGVSIDSIFQSAHQSANAEMQQLARQIEALYAGSDPKASARKLRGDKLRIMGITSRFTTFLKYSMSDWLDAFIGMGHDTLMIMERGDHEIANPLFFADAVINFKPDLILMIDHYRAEIPGLPKQVPCIMWVQDQLPNIFNAKAGAAQGPYDFCLGYGRMTLPLKYGYPARRFVAARMGVNENRFNPESLPAAKLDPHRCDVSYVSHASESPESIMASQLQNQQPDGKRLLMGTFEQMKSHYAKGGEVLCNRWITRMFEQSMNDCRLALDPNCIQPIIDFFTHRVNNAMYRHQSLQWLAELGVNLHIYGRGWEKHPLFSRYAKGIADNIGQLRAICQASKINLQVQPFGAVHQRLLDGLMCGGFFLIRDGRGDRAGLPHRNLWTWCQRNGITSDAELFDAMDDEIRPVIERINWLEGHRWGPRDYPPLYDTCAAHAETDFSSSADSLWPDHYESVAYATKEELSQKLAIYLKNDAARHEIAAAMRQPILDRCTYTAISNRMLTRVADELAPMAQHARSAA